jgi:tetratricopeptide (TPR) repeat protein
LNWDARILELRIVQIRNQDDFDEVFAARYRQAVGRLDEAGPLEVYSELEVLAEINPDYPGLQEQLRRLEIALNLREDPVDQARINQSNQLFQRAQQLTGGSLDQAQVAVSLLEQAVDLNPDNDRAKFLLDQLRIRLGGEATVALTTADEQRYRRAETLFSQGRPLQALSIVERLLDEPENQAYPPLVDLRRRIALRLGI